jgi:hypothetical protein
VKVEMMKVARVRVVAVCLAGVKMERMKVARIRVVAVCWQGKRWR